MNQNGFFWGGGGESESYYFTLLQIEETRGSNIAFV